MSRKISRDSSGPRDFNSWEPSDRNSSSLFASSTPPIASPEFGTNSDSSQICLVRSIFKDVLVACWTSATFLSAFGGKRQRPNRILGQELDCKPCYLLACSWIFVGNSPERQGSSATPAIPERNMPHRNGFSRLPSGLGSFCFVSFACAFVNPPCKVQTATTAIGQQWSKALPKAMGESQTLSSEIT